MHFFFVDMTSMAAASLLSVLLVIVPGFGIASLLVRLDLIDAHISQRTCWSLLLGPTLFPAVDALLLRWVGFPAAILLHVAFGAVGARSALQSVRRIRAGWWWAIAAAWVAVTWTNVDFDWNGRLYQSLFIVDGVKHASVVGAIARYGLPLRDPFFARPDISGYYYYFYIAPALVHWLTNGLIDSRAAYAGATFIALLAFPAALLLVADAAALIPERARRRFFRLTLMLCCVSGLDVIAGLWIWAATGHLLPQLDWWSEEVRWALTSVLAVPHHLTSVMAVYAGSLIISGAGRAGLVPRAAIAGIAFATAFGCSVWVAIAACPILAFWWIYERFRVGTASMWALPLSGIAALSFSLPQIGDISRGRTFAGPPLVLYMRPVGQMPVQPHSAIQWLTDIGLTSGAYLIEFGIFGLGAIAFLTRGRIAASRSTPTGRLLLVAAPTTLILVTFVRSAVINNDFGWRAIWLAQLPTLLWTGSFLAEQRKQLLNSPTCTAAVALGLAATLWDLAGMRLLRPYGEMEWVNEHPQVDFDLRAAYRWADGAVPAEVILQHNPVVRPRVFDFGLYSDRPVAVADRYAQLFGASPGAVDGRVSAIAPIFETPMALAELRTRAAATGIGGILLTSDDPLWRAAGGPPRSWTCAYRSEHSCVMLLETLR